MVGTRRALATVAMAAAVVASCSQDVMLVTGGGAAAGRPVPVPARPDAATCDAVVRSATSVAVWVRGVLGHGLPATALAAQAAAHDPGSDTTTYGIPLTPAELEMLEAADVPPDPFLPLGGWIGEHPELASVGWDGSELTVGVAEPDEQVLRETRCWEIASISGKVAYRSVSMHPDDLAALRARIEADRDDLAAGGVLITEVWVDEGSSMVVVELAHFDADAASRIAAHYGVGFAVQEDNGRPGR